MSLKKGMLYVLIANIINLLITLFTGFILPKFLSIESYSSIKLFQLYITYIGVVSLGFADGMYLRLGGKKLENLNLQEISDEFKTYKIFQMAVTIIAVLCSIVLKNEMLFYCSMIILPVNIGGYLRNLYQAIGKFDLYSKFMNINTFLIFIINVILLFIIKTDSSVLFIFGYIVAYFIYWILIEHETYKILKSQSRSKFEIKYLCEDIKSGFFLLVGNFCNVIFTGIDRLFVQYLMGSIKFAYYSFAVSIENLINVFITPISTVMYNHFCNNNDRKQIVFIKRCILVFMAFLISSAFILKVIIHVWIDKYINSISVLFILFASQFVSVIIRCVHVNIFKAQKKQNKYFKIMLFVIVVSIILNAVLYVIYKDIQMIAFATLIVNIVWFIIGEIEFKDSIMKWSDYVFMVTVVVSFIVLSYINSAFLAFFLYIGVVLTISLIKMREVYNFVFNQIGELKKKICRRF